MTPRTPLYVVVAITALVLGLGVMVLLGDRPASQMPLTPVQEQPAEEPLVTSPSSVFHPPMDRADARVTKKPFGLKVSPGQSPVDPERFSGYHTGVDFEAFPEEADLDVAVRAICTGELLVKRTATGYGGVAVQACELNGAPVTVVYGHLNPTRITSAVGDVVERGDIFAVLGKGYSAETSGERKHLHLSIHRGAEVNLRGYVSRASELGAWMDPRPLF